MGQILHKLLTSKFVGQRLHNFFNKPYARRAGLRGGGQRGQLPRALRCKGAPRDEICLFQIKYSFEKFRDSEGYKSTTLYYIPMLR